MCVVRHLRIAELRRLADEGLKHIFGTVGRNALRDVKVGTYLAALLIDGMATHALSLKNLVALISGRVFGGATRHNLRVTVLKFDEIDRC